jgi:penicillin-binding protein 1C
VTGSRARRIAVAAIVAAALAVAALAAATIASLEPLPPSLDAVVAAATEHPERAARRQILDRAGRPLTTTFTTDWNVYDRSALHDVPAFLREAFITAEDRRFYSHRGVDWRARLAAVATNLRHGSAVRGASTISEQVVRMIHPRPRTLFNRWLEGWEARALERAFGKHEILEFYLNQVPYASNRRGVRQAAMHYFARDLGTLSHKEMLALAVLVRAPSRLDPRRAPGAADAAIARLADALVERGTLAAHERASIVASPLELAEARLPVHAPHFVSRARDEARAGGVRGERIVTTLDGTLQAKVQAMLDERVAELAPRRIADGAVLVVDHATGEILAWAVAGGADPSGPATHIDAVTTPRQPGSALKPFLYALALDSGWTAAEIIVDAPLTESTSFGLHSYRNYSRRHYGPVTLRDALGNSLNVPAVKALQHVGAERFLATLHELGFDGLDAHPDHYGDGIALGTGEVTLLELVQAYAALANGGVFRPVTPLLHDARHRPSRRVFSAESASLVADILSDPDARALEFGRDSVLRFPVQTAVKTGTSSDFRDAWAVGFDHRHAVGVWMGSLDRSPSTGVTGSTGPALLLRGIFSELNRGRPTRPLPLHAALERREVCVPVPRAAGAVSGNAPSACSPRDEWFLPGTAPRPDPSTGTARAQQAPLRFRQPTPGLRLAYDPRLPADAQAFEFVIGGAEPDDDVRWIVDGRERLARGPTWLWPVTRGTHRVAAEVHRDGVLLGKLDEVEFIVK